MIRIAVVSGSALVFWFTDPSVPMTAAVDPVAIASVLGVVSAGAVLAAFVRPRPRRTAPPPSARWQAEQRACKVFR